MSTTVHCDCCHCVKANKSPVVESSNGNASASYELDEMNQAISDESLIQFGKRIHNISIAIQNLKEKLQKDYSDEIKKEFNCRDCGLSFGAILILTGAFLTIFTPNFLGATLFNSMKSQQSSAMPFRNSTSQEIEMAQLPNSNSYSSTNSNKIKKNSTNKTNSKHTATKSNLKAELNHLDATIASIKNQFEEYHKTDCENNSNPTVESSDEVISLSNESDNLKLYFQIRSTIPQCDCCYCITSNTSPTKRTISSEDLIEFGRRIHMMSVEIRNLKIKLNQDYTENIKRKFNCKDCNDDTKMKAIKVQVEESFKVDCESLRSQDRDWTCAGTKGLVAEGQVLNPNESLIITPSIDSSFTLTPSISSSTFDKNKHSERINSMEADLDIIKTKIVIQILRINNTIMNGHQPYSAQSKSLASQEIEMAYLPISSSSISIDSNRTKNSQELYSRNPNSSYTTSFSTESDLIIQLQLLDATIDNIKNSINTISDLHLSDNCYSTESHLINQLQCLDNTLTKLKEESQKYGSNDDDNNSCAKHYGVDFKIIRIAFFIEVVFFLGFSVYSAVNKDSE
ncbi:hypothetical protein DFJ63DRAFT_336900 [Scheffersomyces coipomensis]|uniref:uncharacterized protein n=1 Tax=Scheffersomyces coipomensis TaxID=1788519 RepID=UPI00315C7A08